MLKRLIYSLYSGTFRLGHRKFKRIILVTGSPRSGTTMLAEYLMEKYSANVVWEPLQDTIFRGYNWYFSRRPTAEDYRIHDDLKLYLLNLVTFSSTCFETLWLKNRKYFVMNSRRSETLVIKFTRGNGIVESLAKDLKVLGYEVITYGIYRQVQSVVASQIEHHEFTGHPICKDIILPLGELGIHQRLTATWIYDTNNIKNADIDQLIEYSSFIRNTKGLKYSSTFNKSTEQNGSFDSKYLKTLSPKQLAEIDLLIELNLSGDTCSS